MIVQLNKSVKKMAFSTNFSLNFVLSSDLSILIASLLIKNFLTTWVEGVIP